MAKVAWTRWLWLAALVVGPSASAQLALPSAGGLVQDVTQAVPALPATLDRSFQQAQGDLQRLRRQRLDALLRARPRELDRDADGAIVMRGQIVALAPGPAALQAAQTAGFVVGEQRGFDALGLRVVVLHAPPGMSTQRAMQRLRQLDPQGEYVYNHLYSESATRLHAATPASPAPEATDAAAGFRVGLIDSGVDAAHPALAGVDVQRWGCDGRALAQTHGTAVASLLAGRAVAHGPIARTLYAADLYCGTPTDGAAVELVAALAWMAQQDVAVINISLIGAPNRLLERAVAALVARGHLLVAAVGNDGPAAAPLYPAAYPGVIGVTALDTRRRVLPEAGRGMQVAFAAIGEVIAAAPQGQWKQQRGTSFAAPLVARIAAQSLSKPDPQAAAMLRAQLQRRARDLGASGVDPVYGNGVLGEDLPLQRAPGG
ncbi:S8 family serine peptidase [Xanthomonas sp. 3058]|uniref:S8 family serine peptidase n=1 Tax=Xanthomonas sp. 3058 TaxID=3035314 RepID=UPI0017D129FA|nr:S8 family serine peptidase [Xanthomonas sp. 3058]MBB5862686.1 subtilisin family serine protease [Xanthomonas sp. 3058]